VRGVLHHLVDGLIGAGALVQTAGLFDGLGRAVGVQLIGGLGIQPGHGAAQAQTLGGDHAAVGGGEGLAQDAGIELIHGLVGHGGQTVVTHVVAGHCLLIQQLLGLGRVGDQGDLTLIHNGVELIHNHMVQHLAEVLHAQALVKGVVGHADAQQVALAGVHHALHVVEPCVDLTLDDRLEVGLHLLAVHLDKGAHGIFQIAGVDVRADQRDLVILHLVGILHQDQLAGGVLGGPELSLHVGLADDLALERGGEGHGDGQFLGLDLDVAQLQRALHGLAVIQHGLQRAGHLILAQVDVHHHGEAQRDGAGTGGDHHAVDGAEGVDEGGHALLGIGQQAGQVAGLHVAEDQRRADGHGDNVDDGGHVMTQRDHAELKTHLHAALGALLDDVAHHEGHDALALVVLDHLNNVLGIVRLAQHNGHAGDIAGDQRHAQRTDDGVGNEADAGLVFVGVGTVDVFQSLKNFRADSGSKAGVQRLTQILLIGDQALEHAHAGGQVAQSLDLYAGGSVNGGEKVCGIGEGNLLVCAVLGNGVVYGTFGQSRNGIGTAINEIG